jgi:DNA-binding response OmpR family regulator
MASTFPADLALLPLRQSDRHPIGALDGRDLAHFAKCFVDRLLESGVLVERAGLRAADDLEVQAIDGSPVGFSLDGQELAEEIDPQALRLFEIDVLALCKAIRRANGFTGPPAERFSQRLFHLGEQRVGGRRRSVFLARLLRDHNALDTVLAIRIRADGRQIVVLTPTAPGLALDTARRIDAEGVVFAAISETLKPAARDPFTITIPSSPSAQGEERATARLVVDTTGHTVRFDGREVLLAHREFNLLVTLANEAATDGGFVGHDTLYTAIEGVRTADGSMANDEQVTKSASLIRKALADAADLSGSERTALIESKRKAGYRLRLEPSDVLVC